VKRLPALPLFVQTLGLVIATLIAAQTAAVVVIFSLPPPAPQIYTVTDIAQVIQLGGPTSRPSKEPPLTVKRGQAPPASETLGHRRIRFRNALARALGINAERIVIDQPGPRIMGLAESVPLSRKAVEAPGAEPLLFGRFLIGVLQDDGSWLTIRPRAAFGFDPWQERFLLVSALTALAVSPLAWAFSRRLAAPITALADGAERLGRDPGAPPLDITGSAEVAAAVAAFNQMQDRLRRYVEDRTSMIGAVAHDLRTPLTRLRFRIEAVPEPLRSKLEADVDQMEAMVSSTLSFVRDAATPRDRRKLEVASLVETVMDEAALTGADTAVESADRVVVEADPIALKRLVANLVDNAVKYGGAASARVYGNGDMAVIEIDDHGPGMPESELERVFEPFHRLESSRSRQTGGIGLGLAVVRAVARSHGGDVVLSNRANGGLSARVTLPLAMPSTAGRPDQDPRASPAFEKV
jgi:two-component system OmpR family sensor kinase